MPQALTFSLTNILKFMSYLSPLLITFFMIMYSILTNNIVKGLIFMSGLVIITFINYLLKNTIKSPQSDLASPFCNTLPAPFTFRSENNIFNSPSTSSTIIAFAASFLIYPMFLNNAQNYPLMVFLITLLGINGSVEYSDLCTPIFGIFLGILVGILFGIVYYSLIAMTNKDMAYFTKIDSNNIQCGKPKKQKFKCTYGTKNVPVDRVIQKSTIKYTLPEEERNQKPVCDSYRDSVYAFCNDIPILKWGIGSEGETQAIRNCNYDSNRGRWRTCGYIFDNNRDFKEGNEVNIKSDPKFDTNAS
jgi:hypothetical protein